MKKLMLTSALTLAISVPAFACGGPGKIFSELDLTSEQISQLKELRQEKRDHRKANKAERMVFKERRQALMENYSDEEAEAFATEVAQKVKAKTLAKLTNMQKMMAVLTPEQQAEFKRLMAEHSEDHENHGRKGRQGMFY